MAINISYAAAASITLTATSLADGSWRQSDSVDNGTNLYVDALVGGSVQMAASTLNSTVDIYAYGTYDDGTFSGGASGSDGAFTANGNERAFKYLGSVVSGSTSNVDYVWGPFSVAAAFGGTLPEQWGIVYENNSGASLHATGTNNEVQYQGVEYTTA